MYVALEGAVVPNLRFGTYLDPYTQTLHGTGIFTTTRLAYMPVAWSVWDRVNGGPRVACRSCVAPDASLPRSAASDSERYPRKTPWRREDRRVARIGLVR